MSDSPLELRRRRLRFRAWHRGTREADLLLGSFADRHLAAFSEPELDQFEALLDQTDADLYDWITARAPVPAAFDHAVMTQLRGFRFTP